ncbi:MAG: hypothetical protein ACRDLQ_11670 [Solirubrobacterales bacterium]
MAEGSGQELTPAHRRFLIRDALVIAAMVNAALSALIAWLFTLSEDEIPLAVVPLVEGPSVIVDSVGTFFVLPFLTTLVITTVIWKEMRDGHLTRLPLAAGSFAERLPDTRLRRAVRIGLLCMLALGPLAVVVLLLLDYGDISIGAFVVYKAIFGIALGALVTPLIAMVAFGDEPPPEEAPAAA